MGKSIIFSGVLNTSVRLVEFALFVLIVVITFVSSYLATLGIMSIVYLLN
jgi:hypothetical protein